MKYECDKCGACCKQLIVEIDWIDLQREPRLRSVTKPFKIHPDERFVDDDGVPISDPDPYMAGAMLACGTRCPMLTSDDLWSIYPTRPGSCVGMEAGKRQCQDARQMAGLPPLEPCSSAAGESGM
jgi:Fe-S-cluster containining protein